MKARVNVRNHGVTFEEAETAASSPLAQQEPDVNHVLTEERLKLIAWSSTGALLVVIVSVRGPRPRIISARRATKRERDAYVNR